MHLRWILRKFYQKLFLLFCSLAPFLLVFTEWTSKICVMSDPLFLFQSIMLLGFVLCFVHIYRRHLAVPNQNKTNGSTNRTYGINTVLIQLLWFLILTDTNKPNAVFIWLLKWWFNKQTILVYADTYFSKTTHRLSTSNYTQTLQTVTQHHIFW